MIEAEVYSNDSKIGWADFHDDGTIEWEIERSDENYSVFRELFFSINDGKEDVPGKWVGGVIEHDDGTVTMADGEQDAGAYLTFKYVKGTLPDGTRVKDKDGLSMGEKLNRL